MTRALRQLVKWSYLLSALLIIALAVMVQSGRSFSHLLGDYNQDIAQYLSQKLNAQVDIGRIDATWDGLKPSLDVQQLSIRSVSDKSIVAVERARVRLDILGSLMNRRWVWSNILLSDVHMDFEQRLDGKWHVSGLPPRESPAPVTDKAPASPAQVDALIDMLLLSTRIEFQNSHLRFGFNNGQQVNLNSPSLLLENAGKFHRLSLQVDVDEQVRSVYLVVEGEGDPRNRQQFRSRGFLQLNQFPTSEPIAALSAFLLGGVVSDAIRSEGWVNANLWLDSDKRGKGFAVTGNIGVQRLLLPVAGRQLQLDDVNTALVGDWRYGGDWQIQLRDLQAQLKARELAPINLGLRYTLAEQQLAVNLDRLDLEPLANLLNESGALGQGIAQDVLVTLAPRGQLHNVELNLPLRSTPDWQLRANLAQVAVNAWRGAPALTGVDGYVQVGQRGGFVNIDSQQGFSMHYIPSYAEPMAYEQAQGQVAWRLDPANNKIHVNSGALRFRQGSEDLTGYFWLFMPWQRNTGDIDLYLQVGGRNLSAGLYQKYLPALAPESIQSWLAQSVGQDNPGIARTAGFVYRATLNNKNPMTRSFDLYLDLAESRLDYSPGWPALEQLRGRLLVSNGRVAASIQNAEAYDSRIQAAEVRMEPRSRGNGSLLQVKGSLAGPATDGLRILREGILRRYIGGTMDTWFLTGDMQADLDLAIPLGTGVANPPDAHQQVNVQLRAPAFELQNLQLTLRNLEGRIGYDSRTGLSSEGLVASLFGEPVEAKLNTRVLKGYNQTQIDLQGKVEARTLAAWSKRPELLFLQGLIPYQTRVELNHRPRDLMDQMSAQLPAEADARTRFASTAFARVQVKSDLQDVAVSLPGKLGKPAKGKRNLSVELWLDEQETLVDVSYHKPANLEKSLAAGERAWVDALFLLERGAANQLLNAGIALAEIAELDDSPAFLVKGYLAEFQLDVWQQLLVRYQDYQTRITPVSSSPAPAVVVPVDESRIAGLPFRAQLTLGNYQVGSLNLRDLQVEARRDWRGWQLQVENPVVAGAIQVPQDAHRPLDIKLDYLRFTREDLGLPAEPAAESGNSVAAAELPERKLLDPRDLPLANIEVKQLAVAGDDYGSWSLELRPNSRGVVIDKIRGSIRGLSIEGAKEPAEGARMLWVIGDQGPQTRFIGALRAGDIAQVMRHWSKPDPLESQSAYFNLDIYWPGSPQDFKLVDIQGDMSLRMEKGRFKRNVSAGGDGILRLLSVLNFDSLARRMRMDFSDLYQSGLAYDEINGKVSFSRGTLTFVDPLEVRGPSSRLQMAGTIDLKRERIRTRLVATLPVAGNLTFFTALVTGLPAAAGIYVVSKLFKRQVDQVTSISYSIRGSWDNPKMRFDRLFESEESLRDSVKKKAPNSLLMRPEDIAPGATAGGGADLLRDSGEGQAPSPGLPIARG